MVYFLYAIFFVSCLMLVAAVLLQPGKTDAGALFTSNVSSSALAPRGTATVLSKITIVAATTFMVSALLLAMPALTGNVSVLSSNPETPVEAPANTADANSNTAAPDANPNTAPAADANANTTPPANAANANNVLPVNANTGVAQPLEITLPPKNNEPANK